MFVRRDSAVVLDDQQAADTVAQHRAEAEAKLEGKIEPVVFPTRDNDTIPRRRNSRSARESHGVRDSARNSRQSFASQQFAMSAVTAGCGQGLGWSMADVRASQPELLGIASNENTFPEDGRDHHGPSLFARAKRKSRFRYSVLDPSAGLGENAHHNDDDITYSQQANYIRVMMESGNFDLRQFGLSKMSIDDPRFQTALHAALESFPPGMAANIIEAAPIHQEREIEEGNLSRTLLSSRKSRFSIAVASKTAWHTASNRWSRVSLRRDPDLKPNEKPRFSRKVWSRISWSKKDIDYMTY
ncbi:hypothetical protein TruAng_011404 [Truncatella angustata]|nr:hypothetical protein TruAng_011404 [Truncatella angustata]